MCITLSLRENKLEIKLFLRMSAKHKPLGMNEADKKKTKFLQFMLIGWAESFLWLHQTGIKMLKKNSVYNKQLPEQIMLIQRECRQKELTENMNLCEIWPIQG